MWEDEPCVCDTDFTCMARTHDDMEEGEGCAETPDCPGST
jgi:hypothetical protein